MLDITWLINKVNFVTKLPFSLIVSNAQIRGINQHVHDCIFQVFYSFFVILPLFLNDIYDICDKFDRLFFCYFLCAITTNIAQKTGESLRSKKCTFYYDRRFVTLKKFAQEQKFWKEIRYKSLQVFSTRLKRFRIESFCKANLKRLWKKDWIKISGAF